MKDHWMQTGGIKEAFPEKIILWLRLEEYEEDLTWEIEDVSVLHTSPEHLPSGYPWSRCSWLVWEQIQPMQGAGWKCGGVKSCQEQSTANDYLLLCPLGRWATWSAFYPVSQRSPGRWSLYRSQFTRTLEFLLFSGSYPCSACCLGSPPK